ncbi:MAG: cell division protein FtsL [Clostridia bacterium]|nr:cell division protein FtsL [Clostridia bacterium]
MSRTNLAYDEREFYTQDKYYSNLRIKTVQAKTIEEPQKVAAKKTRKKTSLSLPVILLVLMAFLVLYRGVIITEKCDTVETKRELLEQMQTTNQKTQLEIDASLNLKNVEDVAVTKLNMARPEKNQTIYIKIQQDGVVEKTDSSLPTKAVTNFLGMLKAYLD